MKIFWGFVLGYAAFSGALWVMTGSTDVLDASAMSVVERSFTGLCTLTGAGIGWFLGSKI